MQFARRVDPDTKKVSNIAVGEGLLGTNLSPFTEDQIKRRLALFENLYKLQTTDYEARAGREEPIAVVLSDGKEIKGSRFVTTPLDVAKQISKKVADAAVIAKISPLEGESWGPSSLPCAAAGDAPSDDEEEMTNENNSNCCGNSSALLWDLSRPFEQSCRLQLLDFSTDEGKHVFWHSSAHILGECLELEVGAHLSIGPPLERGFYYDSYMGEGTVTPEVCSKLENRVEQVKRENQPFQRLVLTKEDALEMFKDNPFKSALIQRKVPDGGKTTCYRCGSLIDLCRGPHVLSTGKVKAFAIDKFSATYWLGDAKNDVMQRVYAISFPDPKLLKEYKAMVEEAKKRDHRLAGLNQNLFFFESNMSPGACFWLPDGAKIYNKFISLIQSEYRFRGFSQVVTPNMFSCNLFRVSGHYQNYKENMYCFDVEGQEWALKPMNCPGHCLMFKQMCPSYKQLPIRLADFGVLHRNEVSGSLSGLTRVRRFQQDDAHMFCRIDQIEEEVSSALDFLFFIYGVLGFSFELKLATRPKKALGELALWQQAESALAAALDKTGKPWTHFPGDGAFYGPKIDIRVQDALQRWNQCGTIQLDFQLPIRFNLTYQTGEQATTADSPTAADPPKPSGEQPPVAQKADGSMEAELKPGFARPVIIHRAILGSIERMTAVFLEHCNGKFPFWLSPRQAIVCPVAGRNNDYAYFVHRHLHRRGYEVAVDDSNATINRKIRQGQIYQWNYLLVVGAREEEATAVTLRDRDDPKNLKFLKLDELLKFFESMKMPSSQEAQEILPYQPLPEL